MRIVPSKSIALLFKKIPFIYSWETDTQRGIDTQAEREAGSMQGAWCGTPSRDSGITPWAKGRNQTAKAPRDPPLKVYLEQVC